jgi:ribosomal protein S18 acetylase RimI-like enzyme
MMSGKPNGRIRMLSSADLLILKTIRLEALESTPSSFASTLAQWSSLSDVEWHPELAYPTFVAFESDEPVGMMSLRRKRPYKMAHRAELVGVYVRQADRGKGLASQLFAALLKHARGVAVTQLELGVRCDNLDALRFYHRHGFLEVGRTPNGFRDDQAGYDEVRMYLDIQRRVFD